MRILVLSGSGLSAESGLGTFREEDGLWSTYDMNRVCDFEAFLAGRHLGEMFDFYDQLRVQLAEARPNSAHEALAALQCSLGTDWVRLVTQNVDDLLERAGAEEVVHLHGDLRRALCCRCGSQWMIGYGLLPADTPCPECGQSDRTKPAVVFFGEQAPEYARFYEEELGRLERGDVFLVIGTSGTVVPTHELALPLRATGVRTILVDPNPPQGAEHAYATVFPCSATVGVPRALEAITSGG